MSGKVGLLERGQDVEARTIRKLAQEETRYKIQAMQRLETLRLELTAPQ